MLLEQLVDCLISFGVKIFNKMLNFSLKVIFKLIPALIRNLISLVKKIKIVNLKYFD